MSLTGKHTTISEWIETGLTCHCCDKKYAICVQPHYEYYYILHIPFYPSWMQVAAKCKFCGQTEIVDKQYLSPEIRKQIRRPVWHYCGAFLIFVAVIFICLSYLGDQRDKYVSVSESIEYPVIGDIYEVKIGYSSYSLMKVVGISNDTVFVQYNEYAVSNESYLKQLKEKRMDNFAPGTIAYLKQDISKDLLGNTIIAIHRNSHIIK